MLLIKTWSITQLSKLVKNDKLRDSLLRYKKSNRASTENYNKKITHS